MAKMYITPEVTEENRGYKTAIKILSTGDRVKLPAKACIDYGNRVWKFSPSPLTAGFREGCVTVALSRQNGKGELLKIARQMGIMN